MVNKWSQRVIKTPCKESLRNIGIRVNMHQMTSLVTAVIIYTFNYNIVHVHLYMKRQINVHILNHLDNYLITRAL